MDLSFRPFTHDDIELIKMSALLIKGDDFIEYIHNSFADKAEHSLTVKDRFYYTNILKFINIHMGVNSPRMLKLLNTPMYTVYNSILEGTVVNPADLQPLSEEEKEYSLVVAILLNDETYVLNYDWEIKYPNIHLEHALESDEVSGAIVQSLVEQGADPDAIASHLLTLYNTLVVGVEEDWVAVPRRMKLNSVVSSEDCINESPIMLEAYEPDPDLVKVYFPNAEREYTRYSCILKDELKGFLGSGVSLMSLYSAPVSVEHSATGLTGKPGLSYIARLPMTGIYVTLQSMYRVLSSSNREWYAVDLFGLRRRVGNTQGVYGASMNHGQVPGFSVYRLYSASELESKIKVEPSVHDFIIPGTFDKRWDSIGDFDKWVVDTLVALP